VSCRRRLSFHLNFLKLTSGLSLTCTACYYLVTGISLSLIQRQLGQPSARYLSWRDLYARTQKKHCALWISCMLSAVVHAPAYPITRRACCHLAQSTLTHATASKQSQLISALETATPALGNILLREIRLLVHIENSN